MPKESAAPHPRLLDLGFDPAAPATEAIAKLRSIRAAGKISQEVIAQTLGRIADAEAAAMLVEIEADAKGSLRREVRRALFRLKQHGIEAPETDAEARQPETGTDSSLSALLSPTDTKGARIVWIMRTRGSGGRRRLWALVSEREGLVSINLEAITRKQYRAERTEVEQRAGITLVEADWRLADYILYDAFRHTPDDRRGRVGNFLLLRAELIAEQPASEIDHPIYKEFARELQEDPSIELMQVPEIGAYKLPANATKPYADEISGLRESVIVLNRMQQEDRANIIVERALDELLKDDTAYRLRRHLEDSGYILARTGKSKEAGWAAAAAVRIRDHADLKRIPFFQSWMRAQLGALLAQEQEQNREEPRLIMTPAEAIRARQAAQARMRGRTR
jgi:hypothetical protein